MTQTHLTLLVNKCDILRNLYYLMNQLSLNPMLITCEDVVLL
jgi:hypothetical protein